MGIPELTGVYRPTGRVSKWTSMFLTLALAGGFVACSDDKEPESGGSEDCTDGDTDTAVCGEDDKGVQHLLCVDGEWKNEGDCQIIEDCTDGDTDTVACGVDDKGEQAVVCVDGAWETTGSCNDPSGACDAGDTRTIECGLNDRGEQAQTCEGGQWTNLAGCTDTDVCTDNDTRNVDCGTNGLKPQVCDTGQWVDDGSCVESCVDGDTDTTSCGLNGNGTQDLLCDAGTWVNDGTCDDPDECVLDERRDGNCSTSENSQYGTAQQKCESGTDGTEWVRNGSCRANSLALYNKHGCAVRNDEKVVCWGANTWGQLGDGTTNDSPTPVEVQGLTGAKSVAVGRNFSCAVKTDGDVYCWGDNDKGQLGNDSDTGSNTPVKVHGLTNARAITAGEVHVCAIDDNADAYCWGWNREGQLGIDSTTDAWTAKKVMNLPDVYKIVAGVETTCALKSPPGIIAQAQATDAYCWGTNTNYQAGITGESSLEEYLVPEKVPGEQFFDISLRRRAFCGTVERLGIGIGSTQRTVVCIGGAGSFSPEQGDGDGRAGTYSAFHTLTSDVSYSVPLLGSFSYPQLKAGGDSNKGNVCAIVPSDNKVWCWGNNQEGGLGRGYIGSNGGGSADEELSRLATPEPVKTRRYVGLPIGYLIEPAENIRAIAVGEEAICAINDGGFLGCTGAMSTNAEGYLGAVGN